MLFVLNASVICFVRTLVHGLSATKGHDAESDMINSLLRIVRLVLPGLRKIYQASSSLVKSSAGTSKVGYIVHERLVDHNQAKR